VRCVHCGATTAPMHLAVPWVLRFARKPHGLVLRCIAEGQCERREMRKRGRRLAPTPKEGT